MKKIEQISDREFIFGAMLVISNKMDTLLERTLSKYNVTSKQWFLLLVIFNLFEKSPTIKEVAKEMGSSHQNIKQVALKLEKKGMLEFEKDKKDMRATRLILTEKSYEFWKLIENDGKKFMNDFYNSIEKDKLKEARGFILKLMLNLNEMEEKVDI
ncbi:MAG: MarR family transcriptional regulator [Clostridia bacterium]|nr:MarR family transcriptional regulator [Clostridia bacterium]